MKPMLTKYFAVRIYINLIAALMLVIVTSGCETKQKPNTWTPNKWTFTLPDTLLDTTAHPAQWDIYEDNQFVTIEIDGCQYLQNTYSADAPLTHKGNCNNPIHKTK